MSRICMWDIVQVEGFANAMIVQSVPDDYCVVMGKDGLLHKVKYEDITVIKYKPLVTNKERIDVLTKLHDISVLFKELTDSGRMYIMYNYCKYCGKDKVNGGKCYCAPHFDR